MVTGGAAELGGGAGAGAVLGGATVGLAEEPLEPDPEPEEPDPEPEEPDPEPEEPDPEPDEPDEPEELGEREPLGEAVAGCPACTVGWTPAPVRRVLLWCRCMADGVGVAAAKAEVDGFVLAAVAWAVFWAAAVRANKVAKPTAAIALS